MGHLKYRYRIYRTIKYSTTSYCLATTVYNGIKPLYLANTSGEIVSDFEFPVDNPITNETEYDLARLVPFQGHRGLQNLICACLPTHIKLDKNNKVKMTYEYKTMHNHINVYDEEPIYIFNAETIDEAKEQLKVYAILDSRTNG